MAEQVELSPINTGGTSFLRSCFNGINALTGIGLITIPYTLSQAGWLGLCLLLAMAFTTCYTGLLLQRCLESNPSIKTYPDIGYHAFGRKGRIIVSIFTYLELYLVPTGILILEGDHLFKLFPNVSMEVAGIYIGGKEIFVIGSGLVILPTMWLKDLRLLSFVSAGGILSCVIVITSILWVGAVDGVGFSSKGKLFELAGIPTAMSFFSLSTLSYILMAVLGYLMFGQDVQPQVTLNLPTSQVSSKIAIYTTLIGPLAKYALIVMPIANAIESRLPRYYNIKLIYIFLRTLLLVSTIIVALVFPLFGILMALVGAILSITVSIILPCLCYLKISGGYQKWGFEVLIIVVIMINAVSIGVIGTYVSLKDIGVIKIFRI
ncbi:amino acid transporter AVT1I-like [Quercus lobata]|uniref:amino acid transporter AVT1I-like n=1 Tax=Quercus lobata TaxID=97700 RepID=UPI001247971B|nr:amino acid transporter AVT1I-like [Quercus lobata]